MAERAATQVRRAPGLLIFVPGLGRDAFNSAAVVAESIACTANLSRGRVTATSDTPPAPAGLRAVRTISVDGVRVLDIVELDYYDALAVLDANDGTRTEAVPPGFLRTFWYTGYGLAVGLRALLPGRTVKSGKAKANLLYGTVLMLVLLLAFIWIAASAAALILSGTRWSVNIPAMLDPAPGAVLVGGAAATSVYLALRRRILLGAQRIRQLLRYLSEPAEAKEITDRLDYAIDAVLDQGLYAGHIHVLAYSFGSIVVLDDLAPPIGTSLSGTQRVSNAISSLVTVGCPYDFIRQYRPRYFEDRAPRRPDLMWRNVFIASDVFGSNFKRKDDDSVGSDVVTALNWPVTQTIRYLPAERLTFWGVFRMAGLRQHAKYWTANGGCWSSVIDLWGFPLDDAEVVDGV
ncbi:MAG: hypothetical protein WCP28_16860 [Actinomycetes bacterium]